MDFFVVYLSLFNKIKILLIRQNLPKTEFFARQFYTFYAQNIYNLRPFFSITFSTGFWISKSLDNGLREVWAKRGLNGVNIWNRNPWFFFRRSNFNPFISKSFQMWDPFFPLLFPQDSEHLKSLDIGLQKMGGKEGQCFEKNDRH